jgi:hypothetical protein
MTSAYWSGLVGVVVGGLLSLAGTWIQSSKAEKAQIRADSQALKMATWTRNRKLREKTYVGLASLVIDVITEMNTARESAKAGNRPAPIHIADERMSAIWIESHIYVTDEVYSRWISWRKAVEKMATTIGQLGNANEATPVDKVEVQRLEAELDTSYDSCNTSSTSLITRLRSEMSADST